MKRLIFEDIYTWALFSEERQLDFNGHLWVRPEGNIIIDPVPMSDVDRAELEGLGHTKWIVVTNRGHEREARTLQEWTGAGVIVHEADADALRVTPTRIIGDGETIVPGLHAVHLRHGKSPGEIALYFPGKHTVLFGALVVGAPMGTLTLLPDAKLKDASKAALNLRKILAMRFNTVLVGAGHSIFKDARQCLLDCLQARRDIYINRIHIDDIAWAHKHAPPPYDFEDKDIEPLIGGKNLGYRVIRLHPGKMSFPMHFHNLGEEMCYVMEGRCTLKTPRGDVEVQQGDFIAFPPGITGAHKFINQTDTAATLFILGNIIPYDVSQYPDSNKVLPYILGKIYRESENLSYWDGET